MRIVFDSKEEKNKFLNLCPSNLGLEDSCGDGCETCWKAAGVELDVNGDMNHILTALDNLNAGLNRIAEATERIAGPSIVDENEVEQSYIDRALRDYDEGLINGKEFREIIKQRPTAEEIVDGRKRDADEI